MVSGVGKMAADQGRGNQLHHRISCHRSIAKIDDLTFAEAFHSDEVTELNDIALDIFSISNKLRIAIVEVNSGAESPGFAASHHILDRTGSSLRGSGW